MNEIETPWGTAETEHQPDYLGKGNESFETKSLTVTSLLGRAETSFHVDIPREGFPERLRVVMLAGYSIPGMRGPTVSVGESALVVGGTPMGWRAQAYIDPMAGEVPEAEAVEVMLVADGKLVQGFDKASLRVGQQVREILEEARGDDPGVYARLYAGLLSGVTEDLDADVERARKDLEAATERRDRFATLIEGVRAASEAGTAPRP